MTDFDATLALATVRERLERHQFSPRDADQTDYQCGDDTTLRFKSGYVYGEVTVTQWSGPRQVEAYRVNSERSLAMVLDQLTNVINAHNIAADRVVHPTNPVTMMFGTDATAVGSLDRFIPTKDAD